MKQQTLFSTVSKRLLALLLVCASVIAGVAFSTPQQINAAPASGAYTVHIGCDVSQYQGKINWAQMKASGVEFAIIRVGARNSQTGLITEDTRYVQNIQGALANGIRVGVYIFSQAVTPQEAIEEADFLISRIYGFNITLPVVIDYEFRNDPTTNAPGRLRAAALSKEWGTAIVNTFCERVRYAGYTPMIYANKDMLTRHLYPSQIPENNRIWLAHYTQATDYTGRYDFWQFTSKASGIACGASSTDLDLDLWFDDGTIFGQDYSIVFNPSYYAALYPDAAAFCGNNVSLLLQHFINIGMPEGRQGNSTFNVVSYRNAYPDLRALFGSDWSKYYTHYMTAGLYEGRVGTGWENYMIGGLTTYKGIDYSAVYNPAFYALGNPDVLALYGFDENKLIKHFVTTGMYERRCAAPNFNVNVYMAKNPDLQAAFGTDAAAYYLHYMKMGQAEGRSAIME